MSQGLAGREAIYPGPPRTEGAALGPSWTPPARGESSAGATAARRGIAAGAIAPRPAGSRYGAGRGGFGAAGYRLIAGRDAWAVAVETSSITMSRTGAPCPSLGGAMR